MTTTQQAPKGIAVGTRVEVKLPDYKTPGMPWVWWSGVVEEIEVKTTRDEKTLFDVLVRMDVDNRPHRELVGPRGGNARIRKAA
jgi:hypothetical protein